MKLGSILIRTDDGTEFTVIEYVFWSKITDGTTEDDVKFAWTNNDGDMFVGANSGHTYTLKN